MQYFQSEQIQAVTSGHDGRPAHYPCLDDYPELLFYIQRNQNVNTVVYEVNLQQGGLLNLTEPMKISWLYFNDTLQKESRELNMIQKKLAYGYHFSVIHPELIEFRFVSYDNLAFYLAKDRHGRFQVFFREADHQIKLNMIYIYAEDLGVFPLVKFADLHGENTALDSAFHRRLIFE